MSDELDENARGSEETADDSQLAQPDVSLAPPTSGDHVETRATARTLGSAVASSSEATAKAKSEFAWNVHKYTDDYIRFADTKAGLVLTYSSALIGALYASRLHLRFTMTAPALWEFGDWLALLAYVLLFLGAGLAFLVVVPKLWGKGSPGLLFWDDILAHHSPEDLCGKFSTESETTLEEQLLCHQFVLSKVCSTKYWQLSAAMWLSGIGAAIAAGLLILGRQ